MQHQCPHCGADKMNDGFEVLDEAVVHECRCDECSHTYWLYFADCAHCMCESVFIWPSPPSASALAELDCDCCAHKIHAQDLALSASIAV